MIDLLGCGIVAIGSWCGCLFAPGLVCGLLFIFYFAGVIYFAWVYMAKSVDMTLREAHSNQAEFNRRIRRLAIERAHTTIRSGRQFGMKTTDARVARVFVIGALSALGGMVWPMI